MKKFKIFKGIIKKKTDMDILNECLNYVANTPAGYRGKIVLLEKYLNAVRNR
jgi:hypothetical protein